jgi:hypothetical protein
MKIRTIKLLTGMCQQKGLGRGWSKTVCPEARAAADAGKFKLKDFKSWWNGPGMYVVTATHLNPQVSQIESFQVDLGHSLQEWRGHSVVLAPHMPGDLLNVFLGSMLGDGHMRRTTKTSNTIFTEAHGHEQEEYLRWKMGIWGDLVTPAGLTRRPRVKAHHQDSVGFSIVAYPPLNYWYGLFYPERPNTGKREYKRKRFPEEVVHYITPLGLAVWYMDDGGAGHRPNFSAHPDCHEVAKKILAQFGLTAVHRGKYTLEVQEAERFLALVRPHMHPSLLYKLNCTCLGRAHTIPTEEFLRLHGEGKTAKELTSHFQTQEAVVQMKADRLGVRLSVAEKGHADLRHLLEYEKHVDTKQGRRFTRIPKDLLVDLLAAGTTPHRIAVRLGVCVRTLFREVERHGLTYDPKKRKVMGSDRHTHLTREALQGLVNQGLTMSGIAQEMGVHPATIGERFRRWGLEVQTTHPPR